MSGNKCSYGTLSVKDGDRFGGETTAVAGDGWSFTFDTASGVFLTGEMGGQAWVSDIDGDRTVADSPPLEI